MCIRSLVDTQKNTTGGSGTHRQKLRSLKSSSLSPILVACDASKSIKLKETMECSLNLLSQLCFNWLQPMSWRAIVLTNILTQKRTRSTCTVKYYNHYGSTSAIWKPRCALLILKMILLMCFHTRRSWMVVA